MGIIKHGFDALFPGSGASPGVQGFLERLIPGGETGYIQSPGTTTTPQPLQPQEPIPGIVPAIQRIIPGGQSGMQDATVTPWTEPTPGIVPAIQRAIPGGQSGMQQVYQEDPVVKTWYANGTPFALHRSGKISVMRKNGTVKKYRPYKPTTFGKNPDAKKFIKVAKAHKSMYKELHKVFGKPTRRK